MKDVVICVPTALISKKSDVSEEYNASILRIEE
jgi:hypothetical protein